jgi:phosphate-selective porin O/P
MKKLVIILMLVWLAKPGFTQGCTEADPDQRLKVFGYIQPEYHYNAKIEKRNTFLFNRARLGVTGNVPYDFRYYFVAELSPTFTGYPYLLDAYLSYNRFMWVQAGLGQFKSPFSLELQTPCHKLNTIYRSNVVVELAAPLRDIGLMVYGGNDTTLLKYQFAVMNGTGLNIIDDNGGKDFVGRVVFQPLPDKKLLGIGGSFRYGTSAPIADGATKDDSHLRWGVEANFRAKHVTLQGEYIYGKDIGSYLTGGGCGDPGKVVEGSVERLGWYVTAMYMTKFRLQPVIKYEYYDADISAEDQFRYITTLGINYFFNDWTRLQINYLLVKSQLGDDKLDNELIFQFQVLF